MRRGRRRRRRRRRRRKRQHINSEFIENAANKS